MPKAFTLPCRSIEDHEKMVDRYDDDLAAFEATGGTALPDTHDQGHVEHDHARIWYASYGAGAPVILLHGGLGHSGNWGNQVPALVARGYRAVVVDSRGHGRSTRDDQPFTYERMASDLAAVMDAMHIVRAALVGWSDGAVIALTLAMQSPERVAGVYFFACNTDSSGAKPMTELPPIVARCLDRHTKDYARLSATPDQFGAFAGAVALMQRTQPDYTAHELARVRVSVTIVHAEHDEFIERGHAEYLARTIPGATFVYLPGVSHFAPLQRPAQFNVPMLAFLDRVLTADTLRASAPGVTFEGVSAADANALADLRVTAMRESLERIGRFDAARARDRLLAGFSAAHTRHICWNGRRVGLVVVRPHEEDLLLDHLYITPDAQGQGVGATVLETLFAEADHEGKALRVGALKGSDANRFYARHGFELVEVGEWDNYYVRRARG